MKVYITRPIVDTAKERLENEKNRSYCWSQGRLKL